MPSYICVIPGDGCGREVMAESLKILDILRERGTLEYGVFRAGAEHYEDTGMSWEEGTMERAAEADAILFGAVGKEGVTRPDGTRPAGEVVFGLRNGLDLFANVRPVRLLPGIAHCISSRRFTVWEPAEVDLVIVRELTEGLYVRIGGEVRGGELAIDNRIVTEHGSRRVIEFAAHLAMARRGGCCWAGEESGQDWGEKCGEESGDIEHHEHDREGAGGGDGAREQGPPGRTSRNTSRRTSGRTSLTCVDKSNVLKGDRLFRRVFDRITVEPRFAALSTGRAYADAAAMSLVSDPGRFDVLVMPNMYGDILSDLASVLAGGIGMAPSASYGYGNALFEPIHGSAPDIAGRGVVNPAACLLSTAMMFRYLGGGTAGEGTLWVEEVERLGRMEGVGGVEGKEAGKGKEWVERGNEMKGVIGKGWVAGAEEMKGVEGKECAPGARYVGSPRRIPTRSIAAEFHGCARALENAVEGVIRSGIRTRDLGGTATTGKFGEAVRREFRRLMGLGNGTR